MKINIGEYVRVDDKYIAMCERISDEITYFNYPIYYDFEDPNYSIKNDCFNNFSIEKGNSLIEVIRVGDIVNGCLVIDVSFDSLGLILETSDYNKLRDENIRTVLTKKEYEDRCYKKG